MYIVISLCILYLGFLIVERIYFLQIRKKFKHIIHVNGTRGKSTTVRLIDAGLRNCGYKVFTKSTGTIPMMINTKNEQVKVKRLGLANIREQLRIMRKAYKEKADILVIECMAISPETQLISQDKMLQADISIITNVLHDHLMEMGDNLNDIAESLANTLVYAKYVIVSNDKFNHIFQARLTNPETRIIVAKEYNGEEKLNTIPSNIAIALEVARILHLDLNKYFEGMKNYHRDPAAFTCYELNQTTFLNGFSINDPDSIKLIYELICQKYQPERITILLNSRDDRPSRTLQHIELLKVLPLKKVILMGRNNYYVKKRLEKANIETSIYHKIEDLLKEDIIFAIGNIANEGMKTLKYFSENGVEHHV